MPGFVFFAIAVICLSSASPKLQKKLLAYPGVGTFLHDLHDLEATRHLGLRTSVVTGLRSAARLLGGTNHER